MEKQKNKQRQNGITLIALVVTIIVLIILAGVSINMLVGENGIITQAQTAKKETEQAGQDEQKILDDYELSIKEATGEKVYKLGEGPKLMENPPSYSWIEGNNPDINNTNFYVAYDINTNTINKSFTYHGVVEQAGSVFPENSCVVDKTVLVTDIDSYTEILTIEFETESNIIELLFNGYPYAIVQVDEGQGYEYVTYDTSRQYNGSLHLLKLEFAEIKNRKIKIETNARFGGAYILNNTSINPVQIDEEKAIFIGTSITERKGTLGYYNIISNRLNLDGYNWGVGGTGYVTQPSYGTGIRYNYYNRLVVNKDFIKDADIICIEGGINDIDQNISDVVNEQSKCIDFIRENAPNAKIIIIGVFWSRGTLNATASNLNDALRENCLNKKVPFIDLLTGDTIAADGTIISKGTGPYITGTGHVGAEQGDGNADIYIEEDGTHPTQEGCNYLGNRFAEEFYKILNY